VKADQTDPSGPGPSLELFLAGDGGEHVGQGFDVEKVSDAARGWIRLRRTEGELDDERPGSASANVNPERAHVPSL
jgi:hypothetical protein